MLQTSVSAYVCVFNASYCTSMLTPANRVSLGEPLQTLSELVIPTSIITLLLQQSLDRSHVMSEHLKVLAVNQSMT